jgi:D-3-phosphoglycerate dehydrogenase
MRILGHDPYVSQEHASRLGARLADLPTLLRESDVLTIHTPATSRRKASSARKSSRR